MLHAQISPYHASKNAIQFRNDLPDGLGGTGRRGDEVGNGGTAVFE